MDLVMAETSITTTTTDIATTSTTSIDRKNNDEVVLKCIEKQQQPNEPNEDVLITTTTTTTTTTIIDDCPNNTKTLKRCMSVPNIGRGAASNTNAAAASTLAGTTSMTLRSAATAAAHKRAVSKEQQETPKKLQHQINEHTPSNNNIHIHIPRSNPCSREVSPAPMFNIFAPRARRYSASSSPLGQNVGTNSNGGNAAPLYLTPRVSQLRQEECADINTREVNHEREVHSAMQMSQSWEDLTLVAENWSCKSDELSNPLQVVLPAGLVSCSSPSPTSNRAGLRLPYGLSPSPTRRTFATRRSMSPIAMRPSQLGPVKRKFDLDEQNNGNWSVYSPPPLKKIFTESRGSSPICQSPSSVCPSPDSGTYDGRITPKLFISKLCTANGCGANGSSSNNTNSNSNSSTCSSPGSSSGVAKSVLLSNSNGNANTNLMDEGISISDLVVSSSSSSAVTSDNMQDDVMDDIKSETSSIGGCSSISLESSSSNSFFNRFNSDSELNSVATSTSSLVPKHFFINKLSGGLSGAKKFIVNHDQSDHSNLSAPTSLMGSTSELLDATPATIM